MVFSLSAIMIAVLLIPAFVCLLILKLFFPRHTLKIHEAHFIPFAIGFTLLANCGRIFKLVSLAYPPCCYDPKEFDQLLIHHLETHAHDILVEAHMFLWWPVFLFSFVILFFYYFWRSYIVNEKGNAFSHFVFKLVNNLFTNHISQMTAFSQKKRMLFVDILDSSDSLYSGIFSDYFMEDKKFTGIELTNVIRYSFKSETDRKDNNEKHDVTQDYPTPYLLPNNGKMFFPADQIQNFHIWSLPKDHKEEFHLKRKDKQVRFAWMLGLKYSLPHLNFLIKGYLNEEDLEGKNLDHLDLKPAFKALSILGLSEDEFFNNIEVKQKSKT